MKRKNQWGGNPKSKNQKMNDDDENETEDISDNLVWKEDNHIFFLH